MPIVQSVGVKEDFLVDVNGSYGLMFTEIEMQVAVKAGTILESASAAVSSASTEVLGIAAADTEVGEYARVVVRGNPSTVNAQALIYGDAVADDVDALLAEKDLIVVNK